MTRALILYAHPCDDSYAAALHQTVVEALTERGWEIDDCDLYREGFNPLLSTAERTRYHDEPENIETVKDYVERLRQAEALIMCFPVWNFGYPAILKGFLDRVFLPGVSFKLVDGKVLPNLTNIKKLAAVTTYGGTRFRAMLAGDPPRMCVKRAVWHVTRPQKLRYLALYDMNRASSAKRARHVEKIRREMREL